MSTFWITMGQAHVHNIDGQIIDKDVVVEIEAPNAAVARCRAYELFGFKWSMLYTENPGMDFFPKGIIKL